MQPFSIYAGIVITQRHDALRREAARAHLARTRRPRRPFGSRLAAVVRSLASGVQGAAAQTDALVPPLLDYPYSSAR